MNQGLLKTLRDFLATQPVERAWLFGSYARGEETPDSDVDLLVTYTPGTRLGLFGICGIIDKLEGVLGKRVDWVENGTLYPRIAKAVESEKIQIYERGA